MKKQLWLFVGVVVLSTFAGAAVTAQTTAFKYQGSLNSGGIAANGNHDFEFALFTSGGAQIGGTLTRLNVPVTNGIFAVDLDFGNQFPGAGRLLEVRVRQSGGGAFSVLAPRQEVTSSPYSIASLSAATAVNATNATTATNALQLGGVAASQYVVSGASVINAGTQFNIGGERVLFSAVGNLFAGQAAGANTTGFGVIGNSFFGTSAGDANVNGTFNTVVGASADVGSASLTNATAIGARSLVTQSNSLVLGTINGVNGATADTNVGIGTTAPARRLHVSSGSSGATSLSTSDLVIEDDAAAFQHFITPNDVESGILFGDPTDSVAGGIIFNNAATDNGIQFRTGGNTTRMTLAGTGNLGIGTASPSNRLTVGSPEASVVNASVGVYNAGGTFGIFRDTTNNVESLVGADSNGAIFGAASNHEVHIRTNNTVRMRFFTTGNVNVGGTQGVDPNIVFAVNGTIIAGDLGSGGSQALCRNASEEISACSSSIRYKNNVRFFSSGLGLLNKLRPVSFNWKDGGTPDLGLVAEEVAAVEPLLTTTNDKGEIEGVKYDRIGVVLINAVKEQQTQIEEQKQRNDSQQKIIDEQKEMITNLRTALCQMNASLAVCKEK